MRLVAALALSFFAASAPSLRADLLGTSVSGALYYTYSGPTPEYGSVISSNIYDPSTFYDPNHTITPLSYGNSQGPNNVIIGSGTEFGVQDQSLLITADFTNTGLTIQETCTWAKGCAIFGDLFSFTDTSFTNLALVSDPSNFIESYSLVGDTISIAAISPLVYDTTARILYGTDTAEFNLAPTVSDVPEPSSLALLSPGLLAAIGLTRRRK